MFRCRIYIVLALVLTSLSFVSGQTKEELQAKKAKIQKEIQLTNTLIRKAKQQKSQSLNTLSTLNKQISSRDEVIKTLDLEIKMTLIQIEQLKEEITQTQQSIQDQNKLLGQASQLSPMPN